MQSLQILRVFSTQIILAITTQRSLLFSFLIPNRTRLGTTQPGVVVMQSWKSWPFTDGKKHHQHRKMLNPSWSMAALWYRDSRYIQSECCLLQSRPLFNCQFRPCYPIRHSAAGLVAEKAANCQHIENTLKLRSRREGCPSTRQSICQPRRRVPAPSVPLTYLGSYRSR